MVEKCTISHRKEYIGNGFVNYVTKLMLHFQHENGKTVLQVHQIRIVMIFIIFILNKNEFIYLIVFKSGWK